MADCPDCGVEEKTPVSSEATDLPLKKDAEPVQVNILNPVTITSMDGEISKRELQCLNCGHEWTEKSGESSRQTSLKRSVTGL